MYLPELMGILRDAGVSSDTIDDIKKILNHNRDHINEDRPETKTDGAFGESAAGSYLDTQASIAYQHVTDALTEMVKGLGIYRDNLTTFQHGMWGADVDQQQAFTQVRNGVESAAPYTTRRDFKDHEGGA